MTGIINLYKEAGMTSHGCVASVRKILGEKKVGHAGTLDPQATGVLPILVGSATRCSDCFLDMDKTYVAGAVFGLSSDTQDIWGNVEVLDAIPEITESDVREVLKSFVGTVMQLPPSYSALKKDGVPYYKFARRGEEIERKPRPVNVYTAELLDLNTEGERPAATVKIRCGRGTYIRTLINDIGGKLGCGAVMSSLERTSYGFLNAANAVTLDGLRGLASENRVEEVILPVASLFEDDPKVTLTAGELEKFMQGKKLTVHGSRIVFPGNKGKTDIQRILLFFEDREFALGTLSPKEDGLFEIGHNRFFGL